VDAQVVVIGAGPYGLSAAAHLRAAAIDTVVFGRTMEFWRQRMPSRMLLRSAWEASHISDPAGDLTLDRFRDEREPQLRAPIPLNSFVRYAEWFAERAVPDVDRRAVQGVGRANGGFRIDLADGEELHAEHVVVAAGLGPFAWRPPQFDGLPSELVSHSAEHAELGGFAGKSVLVVGGGQSALESAALLNEAGASAEVVVRAPVVHWLPASRMTGRLSPLRRSLYRPFIHRLLYPPTDVGPPGLNWIVALPGVFRTLPRSLQQRTAYRCIRPAGAAWLKDRLVDVPVHIGRSIASVTADGDRLQVELDDGSSREVDHALLATGFRIDVRRYAFLAAELRDSLAVEDGYPLLTHGLESSVPRLHFVGAPAATSFSPILRFVSGTRFASRELTNAILAHARVKQRPSTA
jgi:FAD-dependent urate hydroxylase